MATPRARERPATLLRAPAEIADPLSAFAAAIDRPALIVSSRVGRGSLSIGEALHERLGADGVEHLAVEDLLGGRQLSEDYARYRWICRRAPALLKVVYSVPFVFQRKLLRE